MLQLTCSFFCGLLTAIIFGFSNSNILEPYCKVSKCGLKLTSEHSAQISTIQTLSICEAECLSKLSNVALPDVFAVYCPDEQFCGIDIQLTHSKALKPLSGKNCSVFVIDDTQCRGFEETLFLSGAVFPTLAGGSTKIS